MIGNNGRIELPSLLARLPNPVRLGLALAGLLGVSILVGIMAGEDNTGVLVLLVGLPVALVGAYLANRYFTMLVLILPLTALATRPIYLPVGNGSQMPLSMLITIGLVGLWILAMLIRRQWDLAPAPFNRPLLFFMAATIFSMPWGILWADPILNWRVMGNFRVTQLASLLMMLALMWVPLIVGRFITRPWQIWFYLWSFIISGLLMTTTQFFNIHQILLTDMGLWGLWFALPLAGLVIVHPGLRWYWRLLGTAALVWHLYLVVIHNSLWVSGWLPTLIGVVALVFLHSRKAFAVVLVAALLFAAVGPGRAYLEMVTTENVDEGGMERLDIWSRNLGIVQQHWLLGTGPAGYAPYNMTYFPEDARSTHNNYFDILAQFGVIGTGLWFWFVAVSLWYGWRVVGRAAPGLQRTTAIVATAGWAAAMVAMMLGDWVLPFVYNQGIRGFSYAAYSWIFLGLLVSVDRLSRAPVSTQGFAIEVAR